MFKKIIFFSLALCSLLFFREARAAVVISEVALAPTEGRFIELYNDGDEAVDLTGWYIQRKTATGSSFGSLVSKPNFEGKAIGAGDYFVISKNELSSSDLVLGGLTLTESNSLQLKNPEQEIADKIGWGSSPECGNSCPANPGEVQSIQKTSEGWVVSSPTPGKENETASAPLPSDDAEEEAPDASDPISDAPESVNEESNNNDDDDEPEAIEEPKPKAPAIIKTKISAPALAFASLPVEMQMIISGTGEEGASGRAYWNFGDGGSLEQVNNFEKFYHTYDYPGDYAILLEYYENNFSKTPKTTSRAVIKIVPLNVTISKVGDEKDFFIELSNGAGSEIDVSNWVLSSAMKIFVLPKNSLIMPKKQMTLSGATTGFVFSDRNNLKLLSKGGKVVFEYSPSPVPEKATVSPAANKQIKADKSQLSVAQKENIAQSEPEEILEPEISSGDLEASVVASEAVKDGNSYLYIVIFAMLIGLSAGAVYFVRRHKGAVLPGEDFKILE